MLRDITRASYNSVWLKSRTSGRWRELTHAAVTGGLNSRTRFLNGGQVILIGFTHFLYIFTRFWTIFIVVITYVTISPL